MKKIIKAAVITLVVFFTATILNVGINLYDSIAKRDARLQGNAAHVEILTSNMSLEQMTYIYGNLDWRLDYVKTVLVHLYLGQAINKTQDVIELFSPTPFSMPEWKKILRPAYTNITGCYPEAENEIIASRHALKLLGIDNPKIGMKIELTYDLFDLSEEKTKTFILSGFFTDYTHLANRPTIIFCSRAFTEAARTNVTKTEENKEALKAANSKHGIAVLFESGRSLEENIEKLKNDFNLTDDHIKIFPAFSGVFDDINVNVFALDFYPAIYINAAILTVIVLAFRMTASIKRAKKLKGGAK
jgi:putative ABC transport system permease protein